MHMIFDRSVHVHIKVWQYLWQPMPLMECKYQAPKLAMPAPRGDARPLKTPIPPHGMPSAIITPSPDKLESEVTMESFSRLLKIVVVLFNRRAHFRTERPWTCTTLERFHKRNMRCTYLTLRNDHMNMEVVDDTFFVNDRELKVPDR